VTTTAGPQWRRWWKLAASAAFGLLLLEVAIRVFDLDVNLSRMWRWHPVLGWTQRHGTQFDITVAGEQVHVEFNRQGFRDVEHELAKPPGVKRLVLIGDSFCEAVQVNLEQTFFRLLQARLLLGGERWEVINLGVGDFGTAQELIALREYGLRYEPDVVVCAVYPLNDIGNNAIALADLCRSRNDGYRPYLVERDGELREVRSQPVRQLVRSWLATFRVFERACIAVGLKFSGDEDDAARTRRMRNLGVPPLDPLLYTYVPEEVQQLEGTRAGWRITERCLEEMARSSRERGAQFAVVVMPFESTVGPQWEQFAKQQPLPAMDPDYPDRRLQALCQKLGAPCVLMRPVFAEHLAEYLPGRDGHLNPAGHRLTAEALYLELVARGVVTR
jgi:hypothetical protein